MFTMRPLIPPRGDLWKGDAGLYCIVRRVNTRRKQIAALPLCLSLILYFAFDSLTIPFLFALPFSLFSFNFIYLSFALMVVCCFGYETSTVHALGTNKCHRQCFLTVYLVRWKLTLMLQTSFKAAGAVPVSEVLPELPQ